MDREFRGRLKCGSDLPAQNAVKGAEDKRDGRDEASELFTAGAIASVRINTARIESFLPVRRERGYIEFLNWQLLYFWLQRKSNAPDLERFLRCNKFKLFGQKGTISLMDEAQDLFLFAAMTALMMVREPA